MRNTVKEGFQRKIKSWSYFMLRYLNLFLTQTPCSGDEGKLQKLTFTLASMAKLTTSFTPLSKVQKKVRERKLAQH